MTEEEFNLSLSKAMAEKEHILDKIDGMSYEEIQKDEAIWGEYQEWIKRCEYLYGLKYVYPDERLLIERYKEQEKLRDSIRGRTKKK